MPRLPAPVLALALALTASGLQGCIIHASTDYSEGEPVFEVVALQHAVAGEVAVSMTGLLQDPQSCLPSEVTIAADQRTNSIVLRGPRKDVAEVREAIMKLDRQVQ